MTTPTDTKFWQLLAFWRDSDPGAKREEAARAIDAHVQGLINPPRAPAEQYREPLNIGGDAIHTLSWRQRGPQCVTGICACGWTGSATNARLLQQTHSEHITKEYAT